MTQQPITEGEHRMTSLKRDRDNVLGKSTAKTRAAAAEAKTEKAERKSRLDQVQAEEAERREAAAAVEAEENERQAEARALRAEELKLRDVKL